MTGCCPAEIIVTVQISQKVYVEYYSTHIGHEVSIEHFRLSYECRRDLAGNFENLLRPILWFVSALDCGKI